MSGDIHARLAALPAFPTLTGARVRLREPRTDDVDGVFALFGDPTAMRYWSSAPMRSRMQAEGRLEDMQAAFARGEALDWIIADRRSDRAMGTCTLFRFDARHRRAEVGYALGTAHWGKGLASEAVSLALDWSFRTLGLHRVEADIDPRNEPSRRLLLRLGFRSEGLMRERFFVGGEATDSELFGLLAQEWRRPVR
ncbi:GNAT family N-acetyltransferase [Luteimonas sp. M1R5S18]|uniref:GNAT family N-acetyltransferase n=1 Tax=Luteimonas rhizosphaericola TaxID=3042024 RepID=A0ABT6JIC5_9GAMM|nr:GNAT family N-acetyltransferase [Luteimonas rhizosphaericola]MDH5830422.1 GNAT family N-acetyltransferase [Luteimonas rhizosphaericola]